MRRHDRDRYQTALFAPIARREALFALYAFNYEIARVRESVSQPALGQIRLEWWRENIATAYGIGPVRRHPVVEALSRVIRQGWLTRADLDRLIDARESDFDEGPLADLAALVNYAEATSSRLIYLALEILEVRGNAAAIAAARDVGIAFAISGLLRALPMQMAGRHPIIPAAVAAGHGLNLADLALARNSSALPAAIAEIAATAKSHLQLARAKRDAIPRAALPALLPGVIANRSLRRLEAAGHNPFAPVLSQPDPLQSWRLAAAMLRRRF